MSKVIGIYRITNPNGSIYIGQSWNILKRKNIYKNVKCDKQQKIYNSLVKYGWEAHTFEIVHELPRDISQEVMNNYETLYWQLYKDCRVKMLNIKEPGSNGKMSELSKVKLSISIKKLYESPEYRERNKQVVSKFHKDHPEFAKENGRRIRDYYDTSGARERNSVIQKERHKNNPEALIDHGIKMKKYHSNPGIKEKHSKILNDYNSKPESKKLQSDFMKDKFSSAEEREKQSTALKNYYDNTPGAREKNSEAVKKYCDKPGTKERQRDSAIKHYNSNPDSKFNLSQSHLKLRGVWLLNTQTGIFYLGFKSAAESANLTKSQLEGRLKSGRNNNTNFIRV